MIETLLQFHFLRPVWLLAIIPAVVLIRLLWQREQSLHGWRRIIASHLLAHLTLSTQQRTQLLQPIYLLAIIWLISILALAGPSWQREATPFAEDQAALVIALKVTSSMLAQDIQPSRLQRARQKIHDLLALRPAASTAFIAYASSAHLVMPLTHDAQIIATFAAELTPEIMPAGEGDAAAEAIVLAQQRLDTAGLPGTILLIADTVSANQLEGIEQVRQASGTRVYVLGVAAGPEAIPPPHSPPAPALDRPALEAAAKAGGGKLILVSADQYDVEQLNRQIANSISAAAGEGERWRDAGYYLLPCIAVLLLLWFRPGGYIRETG